jgi:fused signal recognition particle receptor
VARRREEAEAAEAEEAEEEEEEAEAEEEEEEEEEAVADPAAANKVNIQSSQYARPHEQLRNSEKKNEQHELEE